MTVRVGVVGTSWWADSMYLPALADHPQGRVVAVCGRDPQRAAAFAERWSVPACCSSPQSMIESGEVNAVIVASANDSHYPITMAALDAGLPVLCEKPIATSAEDARAMADRAATMGVTTMVPFTYRWMPSNRWLKQLIDDGYVGQPYHINMRYYAGFARKTGYSWRFDPAVAGAGVTADLGSHWLHLARWYLGEVVEISGHTSSFVARPPRPDGTTYDQAEDSAVLLVRFANGAYGVLQVSAVCWEDGQFGQSHHVEVHGSEGTLSSVIDWRTVQEVRGLRDGETGPPQALPIPDHIWAGARRERVHDTYRDVFRSTEVMTREFVTAVAEGRPVAPDLTEGARVQELLESALHSAADGGRAAAV